MDLNAPHIMLWLLLLLLLLLLLFIVLFKLFKLFELLFGLLFFCFRYALWSFFGCGCVGRVQTEARKRGLKRVPKRGSDL